MCLVCVCAWVFLEATGRWGPSSEGLLCCLSAVGEWFWVWNGALQPLDLGILQGWKSPWCRIAAGVWGMQGHGSRGWVSVGVRHPKTEDLKSASPDVWLNE